MNIDDFMYMLKQFFILWLSYCIVIGIGAVSVIMLAWAGIKAYKKTHH